MMYVFCKFEIPAIHHWPDAPEEVKYLRDPHRHVFHFNVAVEVFHDDRDIEFIIMKTELRNWVYRWLHVGTHPQVLERQPLMTDPFIGTTSCEQIIKTIKQYLIDKYQHAEKFRACEVTVSEDGENGAFDRFVIFPKKETESLDG